ncbi:MAG: hypothetical protein ACJ762_11940 [Solirubrobacteraceae bacterium]
MASRLFRFVQLEVPWPLGPDDGRYVVRRHAGEQPEHVLVLATLGAPERRRLGGKRPKETAPEPPPEPVVTGRATMIPAEPLESEEAAAAWLKGADGEAEVAAALLVLNRALHAHRVALADPFAREVGRDDALVARIGFGAGEQVAEGRWSEALTLPAPKAARQRRTAALRPQERVAALLSGRDVALACELLVLRARADLDAGRQREAALQLSLALETALAELAAWTDRGDLATRLDELAGLEDAADAVAASALGRGLDVEEAAEVERILGRVEAALRARTAAGFA